MKENPALVKELVPELKDLVDHYNQFSEFQKGELIGKIIGKYSINIFAVSGSAKIIKAYHDLKKANYALTFEALSKNSPQEAEKLLSTAQKWNEKHLKTIDNFKIKHLEKEISDWLGEGTKMIKNPKGDPIFLSKDGKRKARFDFNDPKYRDKPHMHLEEKINNNWTDASKQHRIYPRED